MRKCSYIFGFILSLLAMASCTTTQTLPPDRATLRKEISPGDQIDVHKTNGGRLMFTVDKIDQAGLHGEGVNLPYNQIQEVTREKISWWRTGLIALGGAAAAVVAISASKGGGGKSGGGW